MNLLKLVLNYSLLLAGLSMTVAVVNGADEGRYTFTSEQAATGQGLFEIHCVACHGGDLSGGLGGPPLKGRAFRARWEPQTGEALFNYITDNMPPGGSGLLAKAQYAELLAYILRINGAEAGAEALPSDPEHLAAYSLSNSLPPLPARYEHTVPKNDYLTVDSIATAVAKRRSERMMRLSAVSDEILVNPPDGSWLHWRRTYEGQGNSPLKAIHRDNVKDLRVSWSLQLQPSPNEITPLVHDGVMFVASGGRLQALDAVSGDLMWEYFRRGAPAHIRNLAIYGDLIFYPTSDTHLTALNFYTGQVVWERQFAPPKDKLRFSGGPMVVKGVLMQGMSGCHLAYPGGCFIVGLEAVTGKELWRFYTLPRPGQPGGATWNDVSVDDRVGGSVWNAGSYDPELDLAFFGVGNTYKVSTLLEGADETNPNSSSGLYTSATLAIRPQTGELVWHYQHMQRDVWDTDWAFERTVTTRKVNGSPRKVVITGGKMGIFDTLDAATGEYISSYDAGLQNLVESIDPVTGRKQIYESQRPEPNIEKLVCPSSLGHRNWMSTSYDSKAHILYIPLADNCMPYKWTPDVQADIDFWVLPIYRPDSDGNLGEIQAVDMESGKIVWSERRRAGPSSALLVTDGGLVFEGLKNREFRALNSSTGEELWEVRLDAPASSYPVTYAVDGVQYLAVTTGGGGSVDWLLGPLTPEINVKSHSVTLWVFRLSEAGSEG